MRGYLLLAALVAVALAKPGLYKENEEFQYSRSSTDEGAKSGFYGAQRGNMGGNYEKAHNMDNVAQTQMSGVIRQVEGEVGDVSNARVGDIYSAAETRSVHGQGQYYDISNLQGRNFQENADYADISSHSSSLNSGFNRNSGFHSSAFKGDQLATEYAGGYGGNNYPRSENLHAGGNSGREYGAESGHHSAYQTKSSEYKGSSTGYSGYGGSSQQTRMVGVPAGSPVRLSIRPGSTVYVPVAAETYDAGRSSAYTHGSANRDVELLDRTERPTTNFEPSGSRTSKHYESAYKYHKEWEKQDTLPAATTLNIPSTGMNSELVDAQHNNNYYGNVLDSHSSSRHQYSGYKDDSSATKSQYGSTYNTNAQTDAYRNSEALASTFDQNSLNHINTAPKSHQSSYSYHKSWERQGDPYVIVPTGEKSQRLTTSNNQGNQYGSRYRQTHQSYTQEDCECDEQGNVRKARSADFEQQEDLTQQTQNNWETLEQHASGNKEQNGKLEDFGQQSQHGWEDLTQQTHRGLNHYGHNSNNNGKLESFGHHKQGTEDLTQQTQQNDWGSSHYGHNLHSNGKLEDFGQQSQRRWDAEDLTQQTQQNYREPGYHGPYSQSNGGLESFDHHKQGTEDLTQQTQQNGWGSSHYGHSLHSNGKLEDFGQQSQHRWDAEGLTQQTQQDNWDGDRYRHHSQSNDRVGNLGHHGKHTGGFDAEDLTQHSSYGGSNHYGGHAQNQYGQRGYVSLGSERRPGQHDDIVQQTQHRWDAEDNFSQVSQDTQTNVGIGTDQINSHTKPILASENDETQNPFKNGPHTHSTGDLTQLTQTNTFGDTMNENENINGSVQSLWNKIDELVQSSMKDESTNQSYQGNSNYQNWLHMQSFQNYSESMDSFNHNSFRSQFAPDYEWKKSTESNNNDGRTDVGRGDIGPEHVKTTTTLKPYFNNNPQIYTSDNIQPQPRYKTPEEIEALSLSRNKTGRSFSDTSNSNGNINTELSGIDNIDLRTGNENSFGVLGLNQQTQSGDGQYVYNVDHKDLEHRSSSGRRQNENGQRDTNTWLQSSTHQQGNAFNQQDLSNHNLHTNIDGQSQDHLGQETLNLEQQSQTNWGEDIGQVQTAQGQNNQTFNKHDKLKNDFYNELHKSHIQASSHLQEATTSTGAPLVSSDFPLGESTTTPKPGFWKSVGNKVASTTGKVASWFKTIKVN